MESNESVGSDYLSSSKETSQDGIQEKHSTLDTCKSSSKMSLIEALPVNSVSVDSETDFFNEDLNINNVPNEKITEDVEDIVQDLENLLGESDEFVTKNDASENKELESSSKFSNSEPFCMETKHKESSCKITFDKETTSYCNKEIASESACTVNGYELSCSRGDSSNKDRNLGNENKSSVYLNMTKSKCEIERMEEIREEEPEIKFSGSGQNIEMENKNVPKINEQLRKEKKELNFQNEITQKSEVIQEKSVNEDTVLSISDKIIYVDNNTIETSDLSTEKNTGDLIKNIALENFQGNRTINNKSPLETQSLPSQTNEDYCCKNNDLGITSDKDDDSISDERTKSNRCTKESSVVRIIDHEKSKIENVNCDVTTTVVNGSNVDIDVGFKERLIVHTKKTAEIAYNENISTVINDVDDTSPCNDDKNIDNIMVDVVNHEATTSITDNLNLIKNVDSMGLPERHSDDHENDKNTQHQNEEAVCDKRSEPVVGDKNLEYENKTKGICFEKTVQDAAIDAATDNAPAEVYDTSFILSETRSENVGLQSPQNFANDTSVSNQSVNTEENLTDENKNELLDEIQGQNEISDAIQLRESLFMNLNNHGQLGTETLQLKDGQNSQKYESEVSSSAYELNVKSPLKDDVKSEDSDQEDNTIHVTDNTLVASDAVTQENINTAEQISSQFLNATSNASSDEISNDQNKPFHYECCNMRAEKLIVTESEHVSTNNLLGSETQNELTDQQGVNIVSNDSGSSQSKILILKEDNIMAERRNSVNQRNDTDVSNINYQNEVPVIELQLNEMNLSEENDVHLGRTDSDPSGSVTINLKEKDNGLYTEIKPVIDLSSDETKIAKSPIIKNNTEQSKKKSVSYSKEIKEIFESEDATESAVASILSETVKISVPNEIETANTNISQLPTDANNSSKSTSPEITIAENDEVNILEKPFESEKTDEFKIKTLEKSDEVNTSENLTVSGPTKDISYFKSVKTLAQSHEILKQPLEVDIIEHINYSEKNDQISTSTDGECDAKNSLKITITKNKFDNMHSILKIYDPKEVHLAHEQHANEEQITKPNEFVRGETIIPKITIKPIPLTEGDFGPKYEITSKSDTDDSTNKHFTVETVEGQCSPKLRIKSVYTEITSNTDDSKKNKDNEREIFGSRKILKSKTEDTASNSKITKYSKTGEEVTSSHSPKITIKPIKLPEETREEPSRSQSPKIIFKPISKLQEPNSKIIETHGRQSPRITIKPIIKPGEQESSRELKVCPKITIKPISKPENEICDELQIRKLSFKSMEEQNFVDYHCQSRRTILKGSQEITRHDEQTCTPRITIKPIKSDKEFECYNMDGISHTPRITIKPIFKPDQTGKTPNKYSEDVIKEERRHSPRLVNKLLMKNEDEFKSDSPSPAEEVDIRKGPKLTIKSVIKQQTLSENSDQVGDSVHHSEYVVDSLQNFKEKKNISDYSNTATVTFKPLIKSDTKEIQYHNSSSSSLTEESVIIPKITIKPIVKHESHTEEKSTPKIIIKPLVKPQKVSALTSTLSGPARSEIVSFVNKSNIDQATPEIKRIKLVSSSKGESYETTTTDSSLTLQLNCSKGSRKNAEEVGLIDFEDQIKQERIVLKINKGTISSPSRSSSDKIEKLTRLKTKLAKDSNKRNYPEHLNYETKKQKIEMGDVTISLIDSESSHDSSDNASKIGAKSNEVNRNYKDSVEIIPLDSLKRRIEREDDAVVVVDPLEDIPIFEITPETAVAMKQATHLLKPGISVSTAVTPSLNSQPQTPRKRGRPRKVPLEVREDFKDPPKEEAESVQTFEQNISSRPKRSCRGQSVRSTLGIKLRKPRGGSRGRGRGRRGGKQAILMKMSIDTSYEEKEEGPLGHFEQKEVAVRSVNATTDDNNESKRSTECDVFSSTAQTCSNEISSMPETFPVSSVIVVQSAFPPVLEPPKSELYEEETRMSADNSRAHTPAKQAISTPLETTIEESQSSMQSTATTESEKNQKNRKVPKQEVHLEPEGEIISADKLAEYCWGGGGPFMLQEQVAQFLGIKSFKRKYPGIHRRPVDMQERDFIRESGLASEAMCDMGLTAVKSEDILDIMYADFQPKYEEYCKHQRDRHAKDISNKQKALNLAATQEKNKLDIVEQAIHSASAWNTNFNKTRREQRKGCMDLQTFTIHFPKGKLQEMNKSPSEHYPVALVPGQFCQYYKMYTPPELSNLPLNTCTYKTYEEFMPEIEDSLSEVSGSESGSSCSDSESSDSSSGIEDCKMCRRTSSQRKILTQ